MSFNTTNSLKPEQLLPSHFDNLNIATRRALGVSLPPSRGVAQQSFGRIQRKPVLVEEQPLSQSICECIRQDHLYDMKSIYDPATGILSQYGQGREEAVGIARIYQEMHDALPPEEVLLRTIYKDRLFAIYQRHKAKIIPDCTFLGGTQMRLLQFVGILTNWFQTHGLKIDEYVPQEEVYGDCVEEYKSGLKGVKKYRHWHLDGSDVVLREHVEQMVLDERATTKEHWKRDLEIRKQKLKKEFPHLLEIELTVKAINYEKFYLAYFGRSVKEHVDEEMKFYLRSSFEDFTKNSITCRTSFEVGKKRPYVDLYEEYMDKYAVCSSDEEEGSDDGSISSKDYSVASTSSDEADDASMITHAEKLMMTRSSKKMTEEEARVARATAELVELSIRFPDLPLK